MLKAVATGYKVSGKGFVPTFDVLAGGHKLGVLAGGYRYESPEAAVEAGKRVVEYTENNNGTFPNICEYF